MNLLYDLRFTLRLVRRNLSFSLLAMFVIALGLGIILTLFNLTNNLVGKTLPYAHGERFIAIFGVDKSNPDSTAGIRIADGVDHYVYRQIAEHSQSYQVLGAARLTLPATISDGESPQVFTAALITANLLGLPESKPILGRSLSPTDSNPDAEPVVLLGYDVWQNYFAGNASIVGRTSRINGDFYTIVGVMPEGFSFPVSHQLWLPLNPGNLPGTGSLTPIGVLKEGVTTEQANAELTVIMAQIQMAFPDLYRNLGIHLLPYTRLPLPNDNPLGPIMTIASLVILMLVCLNVSNLLLARVSERSQELMIRKAMGGTRWRIVQQVLMESLIVCLCGLLAGLVFAVYGIKFMSQATAAANVAFWMSFELDSDTIVSAIGTTMIIWLATGGVTAWRASQPDISGGLNSSQKGTAGKNSTRLVSTLVSIEVIFSVLLLVVSGALVSTMISLQQTNYGTATDHYLTARLSLSGADYQNPPGRNQYYQELLQELKTIPGVIESTLTTALPGILSNVQSPYALEDRDLRVNHNYPIQSVISVTNNYFEVMAVSLVNGRPFNNADTANSMPVVIADELFTSTMWPDDSPLGKRVLLNPSELTSSWLTIIGVTPHIIQAPSFMGGKRGLTSLYRPLSQEMPQQIQLAVKVESNPNEYRQSVIAAATTVDRDIVLTSIYSLNELHALATSVLELVSSIFATVSCVVLVLAATGIYGLVSRGVLFRAREIGVRRALGLTNEQAIGLFLRQGSAHLFVGLLIGGGAGLMVSRAAAELFPEILDVVLFILMGVSILMTVLVLTASWFPARKVVAMEPGVALHYE